MAVVLQDVGAALLSGWWAQCLWWSFGMSWLSNLLGVLTLMRALSSVSNELLFLQGGAVILNGKWGFCLLSHTVSPKSSPPLFLF